ncbi:MAG TPA: penicillin-binding protein 2, partial [Baekduia sp.]|nr:penicillin-binding protein 2 [Baekduia sp.]
GTIVDRKGVELAVSQAADDVSATPYLVRGKATAARRLAPLLRRPESEVLRALSQEDTGFVYLARQVPARRADRIRELNIEGIDLSPGQKRSYPHDHLASQVLGHVGTEGKGLSGLEYRFEDDLRGRDGKRRRVRDGVGDAVSVRDTVPTRAGKQVRLTIDAAIQDKVEEVLAGLGATYRPKGATAVVMNPQSSEVLALANWPRVDANDPAGAPGYASQNRAVGSIFEPGSTFKAITVAGALEEGVVTPTTQFTLPPQIVVADRTIGESHPRGTETMSTAGILAQSSNVGAIKIGMQLGAKRFDRWMRRFGFGRPTGIALPGEERGLLLDLDKYSGSTMGNLPIGQGQAVTSMQMAQAYAAIANGGVLRTPQIVRAVGGSRVAPPTGRRVLSERTATALRGMLRGVFKPGGTASEVQIPGYDLAGKTGTANKVDEQTGEYSESRYVASFVGFAPTNDPRLLISIMVDEPQTAIYGGQVAAPAFGRIAAFALPYLGIEPR